MSGQHQAIQQHSYSTTSRDNSRIVYKVWSRDRKLRKCVVVDSNQRNQLDCVIQKAGEKLSIPSDVRTKLVLEEDGTEVDDDEILQQWASRTFLLLRADEDYHAERPSTTTTNSSDIPATTSVTSDVRAQCETSQRSAGKVGGHDLDAGDGSTTPAPAPVPVSTMRRSSLRARAPINVASAVTTTMTTALTSVAAATSSSKSAQRHRTTSRPSGLSSESPVVIPAAKHKRPVQQQNGLNPLERSKRPRSTCSSDNYHSFSFLETIKPLNRDEEFKVSGVVYVNGRIYCIRSNWSTIGVFSGTPPFQRQNSINIPGIKNPGDLVGSENKKVLYVIDFNSKYIWRINLENPELQEIHIKDLKTTGTLTALRNNGLMFTDYFSCVLIFDEDGSFLKEVKLDKKIQNALHAVEVEVDKKCLISGGLEDYSPHQVVQAAISGRSKKLMFGSNRGSGPDHLNNPSYLAVERSQNGFHRVFVADELNGRIVVLDNELKLLKLETVERDGDKPGTARPHRLCYVEADKKKLLLVASGQNILIYEV